MNSLMKEAITEYWGERCPDFDAECSTCKAWAEYDEATKLRAVAEEHKMLFDTQWEADQRAIKRWQKAHPGNDLTWPDRADMIVWLLERDATLRAEVAMWKEAADRTMDDCGALRAEVERLRAALDAWACACRVDVTMEGAVFRGIERSAAARAWKATLDALGERTQETDT